MGESDAQDRTSLQIMRAIVSVERPDMIVFSGDQVAGYAILEEEQRLILWQKALSVAVEFGIPFATIFGNHDDQPFHMDPILLNRCTLAALGLVLLAKFGYWCVRRKSARQSLFPMLVFLIFMLCITNQTPVVRRSILKNERLNNPSLSLTACSPSNVHGVSNYRLVLQGPDASVALYFLDTGGGWIPEAIHGDQLEWLRGFDTMPSLAFMHIPPQQYGSTFSSTGGCLGPAPLEASSTCPGSEDLLLVLQAVGVFAVFVGHDHGNAWCCRYNGIMLCYGKHTGFGGYDFNVSESGARVIDIDMRNQSNVRVETRISWWYNH